MRSGMCSAWRPPSVLLAATTLSTLAACAGPTATVSIPIGPFGRVGVSVGSGGAVNGHVGVGTSQGGVSVGAGVDVPISEGK
jgi:hypothetical protein